jgi:hypothetical protein
VSDASFRARFHVQRFSNAAYFAGELFHESFGSAFPVPPEGSGWAQYVAFYRWEDALVEPVGFCNYLPFGSVWLEGGLCVRRTFYSRLPAEQGEQCRQSGGVAELIMRSAANELNDGDAWFAYIGDARSLKVCTRVGYVPTNRQYVMVKWFRTLSPEREAELIEHVAALGPF